MHQHKPVFTKDHLNKAFVVAIGLNLGFTGIEAIFALLANSSSLLADAGHNLGDVMGLLLAYMANRLTQKSVSSTYSYGFKRSTILAAIANALILVVASCIIGIEAIFQLMHPHPIRTLDVMIIASIGIFVNAISAWLFVQDKDKDLNVKGAFLHLMADAAISLGVVIAAIVIYFTGWMIVDPIVGLIIVGLILVSGYELMRDSLNLALDAVPRDIQPTKVIRYLENVDGVIGAHHLHIWALSTSENALTVHLVVQRPLNNKVYRDINQSLQKEFNIHHATIQTEIEEGKNSDCKIF